MKEPDKWCIKITPENKEAIEKWKTANATLNGKGYCVNKTSFNSMIGYWYPDKPSGYIEISFEEFKVYTSKPKDLTGRYVKCLVDGTQGTRCKVGEIYKLVSLVDTVETQIYKLEDGLCLCISSDTSNEWELLPEGYSTDKPLKQAVHCTTQKEWDFVTEKLGNDGTNWFKHPDWGNNKSFCMSFEGKNQSQTLDFYINAGYQILSFQEWCDLNGYKMEKEAKFEVGRWYHIKAYNQEVDYYIKCDNTSGTHASEFISGMFGENPSFVANAGTFDNVKLIKELSLQEIQQYLPEGHPDKITPVIQQTRDMQSEFKAGDWVIAIGNIREYENPTIGKLEKFSKKNYESRVSFYGENRYLSIWSNIIRHATPEEIISHLISIEQIPAGEQVPEKYPFKPLQEGDLEWEIETPTFITNLQMGIIIKDPFYSVVDMPTTGNSYNKDFSTSSIPVNPKMILSTDDEELPMVNIIKTNTVKQLLNSE